MKIALSASLSACALVFALAVPVSAQTVTGAIMGTVTDDSGGIVPGVTVTVVNTGTNFNRAHITDEKGHYEVRQLPIGPYEVSAELQGFKKQLRRLQLTVGSEAVVDFSMQMGNLEETVVVTAEAAVVQTSSAEVGALVDQKQIQQLPLNARDIQQLATIQPGVQSQAAYNGLYGANISVRGSRPEQNRYLLNGIDASTTFGTSPVSAANIIMGVEGLQEFKVLTSDYSAAYGMKQGGVVNMVTKSGTQDFHGSLYEFHRDDSTESRNYFATKVPDFKRDQFGASIGGPVKRGKTFFFTNYEQFRQRVGLTYVGQVPTDAARQGLLPSGQVPVAPQMQAFVNLMPRGNGSVAKDGYTQDYLSTPQQAIDERYVTVRIDHQLNHNNQLWGVYTGDWSTSDTPEANPSFATFAYRDKHIASVENAHTFSDHLLNSTRFGYNRNWYFDETTAIVDIGQNMYVAADPFVTPSGRGQFESISIGGMTGMATSGNAPVWYQHNGFDFSTEFNYLKGDHSWKFGGAYQYAADNGSYTAVQARGEISFDTYQQFLSGVASRANVILPGSDPRRNFRSHFASLFTEDSWRVHRNLTMSLGVRWEALLSLTEADGNFANLRGGPMDPTPTVGNPVLIAQKGNVAPRAGFNWDVFGDGKMSVRGGGGMFYNQINPFSLRESSNNYPLTTQYSLTNVSFPNVFDALTGPVSVVPDFGAIEFRPKTPVLYSYHASLQRELRWKTAVTVSYVGSQGRHLPSGTIVNSDWGNRLVPQIVNGQYFWPAGLTRPNPNFGRIGYGSFVLTSNYNAFQMNVERRLAQGFAFGGNYTYAKCFDEASGELNTALGNGGGPAVLQYSRDLKSGYGPCSFVSVNSGNITSTWDLPGQNLRGAAGAVLGGWRWSTIWTMQGGVPFEIKTGFNRSRQNVSSSSLGDRPNWAPGCDASKAFVGDVTRWFDVNCFVLNDAGYLGNVEARAMRGPGLFTSDWSLTKNFSLGGGRRIEVQAQAFNITNRANFRVPAASLWLNANTRNPNAGRITATVTPARQMQFGVKYVF